MTSSPAHRIAALLDKQEIAELMQRYCRGVDRRDDELIRSVYHPDVHEHHGAYRGHTAEDFVAYANGRSDLFESVSHYITNQHIELDGDTAYSETYAIALHQARDDEGRVSHTVFGGRYIDRLERRGDRWGIADRIVVCDWSRVDEVTPWERQALFAAGRADRTDPSYDRGTPGPAERLRAGLSD
jgi:hypothetical protein